MEQNCVWLFYYFNFERNYDVLKPKSPCILLNKNINFNENGTELTMENPTHGFRETNLVFQLLKESKIKSNTVMSWSPWKKKEGILLCLLFCPKDILLNICVLSQCIVYGIHFQNIHTFAHQKAYYFMHFCWLFLKLSKAFSAYLKFTFSQLVLFCSTTLPVL